MAATATAARADTSFYFDQDRDGTALVGGGVDNAGAPHQMRLDIVRGGAVVVSSGTFFGSSAVTGINRLLPGDLARLFQDGALVDTAGYDGLPTIHGDACVGASSFTGDRAAAATVWDAGAYTPGRSPYSATPDTRSIFSQGNPFTVTLDRPLAAGQVAYAETLLRAARTSIDSYRELNVAGCPAPPPPPPPPRPTPVAAFTDAQIAQAVKQALGATAAQLRKLDLAKIAKRRSIKLTFACPLAGTVKLQLTARVKGKTVKLGSGAGSATAARTATVTVKLSSTARKAFKRAKRSIKLTLKATFTAARAGAKPQSASAAVTVKRKAKR